MNAPAPWCLEGADARSRIVQTQRAMHLFRLFLKPPIEYLYADG